MKTSLVLGVVLLFLFVSSAAADFTLVRSFPAPVAGLTGLENADGVLFGVAGYGTGESCLFRFDPADGTVFGTVYCLTQEPPGCPGIPSNYVSCAFKPWNSLDHDSDDPICHDTYWVGEECGDLLKFTWTDSDDLIYAGHCRPDGMGEPAGLAYHSGHIYVLDRTNGVIFKVVSCSGALCEPIELPQIIANPSALTIYGGNFFVSDAGTETVYELDSLGGLIEAHNLEGFSPCVLYGMTFIGEHLFVASDCEAILVYEFGSGGFDIPEGDSVAVEPLPDELEIVFPTVVDSGSLYVEVNETDPCPAPDGVRFLPSFYEIVVTASFDYVAQVAILTEDPPPEDINPDLVRIFRRPSGDCMPYMDVTTAPFEIVETSRDPRLARLSKRLSEDDEFSVFILAEDRRHPMAVINLKYNYLQEAIDALMGVPVDPVNVMNALLAEAIAATRAHRYGRAATLVDRIADVALATPEIPHTFDPGNPGNNLGGRIVARAHTLSFSLRRLVRERVLVGPRPGPALAKARPASDFSLSPNPSSSGFTITLSPSGEGPVSLRVYSVDGRVVRTLLEDGDAGGNQVVTWDGTNDSGGAVAVGTYFAVLTQGDRASVEKIVVRK